MQEGIGRSGYRVIALVFFGLGVLGFATAVVAVDPASLVEWLGFSLAGIALVALAALCLVVLAMRPSSAPPRPDVVAAPIHHGHASNPDADLGVEYDEPVDEPEDFTPIDTTPPEPQRLPPYIPPRKTPAQPKGDWPARKGPSGMTRGEALKKKREQPEFEAVREPPLVMARTAASAEASGIPDNVSLGKCGNCQVLLLAPKKRPIRLQCPRCERVHTMA